MDEEDVQIDRFLAGAMESAEAKAFVKQMQTDGLLRRKVSLRRELNHYLSSGEADLVDLLEEIGKTEGEQVKLLAGYRWWLLLVVIPVGLLLWQLLGRVEAPVTTVATPTEAPLRQRTTSGTLAEPLQEAEINAPETSTSSQPSSAPAAAPATTPTETPATTPKQQEPPPLEVKDTTTAPPVYASLSPADFAPNSYLEDIITSDLRSAENTYAFVLSSAQDTIRLTDNPTLSIITRAETPPELEFFIYDNLPENFLKERPLQQLRLNSWEEIDEKKVVRISLEEIARPGRYYLVLVDGEGEFLAGKRLLIR